MSNPRIVPSVEVLETLKGETFGPGEWLTVDQAMIDAFAQATGDHQWIHVNPKRAAETPFGRTVAHGNLTLALVPRMLAALVEVRSVSEVINCSIQRAVLPTPVPSGARIRLVASLRRALKASSGARNVTWNATVELEGSDKPALDAQLVFLYRPAAPDQS